MHKMYDCVCIFERVYMLEFVCMYVCVRKRCGILCFCYIDVTLLSVL
jgi:hypothetical protein